MPRPYQKMPTYEYKCDACGKAFERFQSITAVPVKKCPYCRKNKVKRLISMGAGLIFKGSGFYITDYRSDGYKKSAQSDSSGTASTTSTSSGDGKTPAASATAAPAKTESKKAEAAKS